MSRVWFTGALETVATFWRIARKDGVTLGFTSHDRDLWFDGVVHRAAPGMVPSAIRRSAGLDDDSAEVAGALSHDTIAAVDIGAGRFDGAGVRVGLVDWESGERETVYLGSLGTVAQEDGAFTATLVSRKAELLGQAVPRTSPACRAEFCGPGCNLSPAFFTHEAVLTVADPAHGLIAVTVAVEAVRLGGGTVRWLDEPLAGACQQVLSVNQEGQLMLDWPPDSHLAEAQLAAGARAMVREGCDHTLETCASRFGNAANFRGEPFLPGNDLLARYPSPAA